MKTRKGYKTYPLTAAQSLHHFSLLTCPLDQLLNIGSSLTIQLDLDWDVMREAIREAVSRSDSMKIRFALDKKENKVYQYLVEEDDAPIEHFDFTGWREEDAVAKMNEWTSTPFPRYDTPMHKIVMVKMPDGYQGTYVCVDHMTMDAQSLIAFFRDIIEIYSHKKYNAVDYPKEMSSYIEQLKKDLAYEAGSKASQRDREFFHKLIESGEPMYTNVYGPAVLEAEREKTGDPNCRAAVNETKSMEAHLRNFHLTGEPSSRLFAFCEEHHVSMTCLLMMGLRTYMQKMNNTDDVSITTTVARRATLTEKRSGGTRIHCFPFRTIVPLEDTFLEGICKIRDGQNMIFRHANFSSPEYFYYRSQYYNLKPGQTYEGMALTYQPMAVKYEGPGLEKLEDIKYKAARYGNGVAAQPLYLTVSHHPEDDGLDFCFEYQDGMVTPEKLEEVYYFICRILFHGVEDCNRTVGEIIDWA
ncbi:MAG: condensation domain-containing protein [Lachnospiraceae bacterium]|nr:condensation domain-containing protein [Lachnospiraceae bacterium]